MVEHLFSNVFGSATLHPLPSLPHSYQELFLLYFNSRSLTEEGYIISIVLLFVFKKNDSITQRAIQIIISLGFWQYIYVVPLMLWQIVKHKKKLAYGMFAGSLPALLINIGLFVWIIILFKDGIGL